MSLYSSLPSLSITHTDPYLSQATLTFYAVLPYVRLMFESCPFCQTAPSRIVQEGPLHLVIRDGYPISDGHTLVIPRRHIASFFDCSVEEHLALLGALRAAKVELDRLFSPSGYNIGINDGQAAGQTVGHLHIHLIPRYRGDQPDPRGGVRWIFPDKAKYWDDAQ